MLVFKFAEYILSDRAAQVPTREIQVLSKSRGDYCCALVCFASAIDFRFGGANDEVFDAQTLEGLECYALHEVRHSGWIAELQKTNAVHFGYSPAWWRDLKHYFFAFHDQSFECIAKGYTTELYRGPIREVVQLALDRVFQ